MLDHDAQRLVLTVQQVLPFILSSALHVAGALVILVVGFWLAGRADALVTRALGRTHHLDEMLKSFFGSITRYFVLTLTLLAVLSQFGIETTSLVTVIGAASLAIGLALQGTLSHLAAGVMLLIFRPFRIGNHVQVGGIDGTVHALSLFWTEIVTADNVQVIIPNGSVWGQALRNFSIYPTPNAAGQVRIPVPAALDLVEAEKRVRQIVATEPGIVKDPAPLISLDRDPADHSLAIVVDFAVNSTDPNVVKQMRSDLFRAAYAAFETKPPSAPSA